MRHGLATTIAPVVLSLVGFLCAATIQRFVVDWRPRIEIYTEKLEHLHRIRHDVDVVFVGSSRIYRHVDPREFDGAAARSGRPLRSYNMGVDGLSLIEMKALIEEIIGLESESLKYILMEPSFRTNLSLRNILTRRAVFFHDLDNTMIEVHCNLRSRRYRYAVQRNALACLYHYSNLGALADTLFPGSQEIRYPVPAHIIRDGGFLAQDDDPPPHILAAHEDFMARLDSFRQGLLPGPPPPESYGREWAAHDEVLASLLRRTHEAGVEPVVVLTPGLDGTWLFRQYEDFHLRSCHETLLMSYLVEYPEVRHLRYWYDPGHLTGEGARVFSRKLGEDFAGVLLRRSRSVGDQG